MLSYFFGLGQTHIIILLKLHQVSISAIYSINIMSSTSSNSDSDSDYSSYSGSDSDAEDNNQEILGRITSSERRGIGSTLNGGHWNDWKVQHNGEFWLVL